MRSTNEKIAKLPSAPASSDTHSVFTRAAQLTMEALGVATELEKMPGIEPGQMQLVIDFWYSRADQARTAALACVGGNQTLAQATVAFLFLQTSCARKPAGVEAAGPDREDKKRRAHGSEPASMQCGSPVASPDTHLSGR